jgi:hypothetical protein
VLARVVAAAGLNELAGEVLQPGDTERTDLVETSRFILGFNVRTQTWGNEESLDHWRNAGIGRCEQRLDTVGEGARSLQLCHLQPCDAVVRSSVVNRKKVPEQ